MDVIDGVFHPGTPHTDPERPQGKVCGTDAAAMDWLPVSCVQQIVPGGAALGTRQN